MHRDPKAETRAFVERWQIAGARLDEMRREGLRNIETGDIIESLNLAFEATLAGPVRTTSGLVEQQAIFATMRDAGSVSAGE